MTQLRLLPRREQTLAQYLVGACSQHRDWAAIIEPCGSDQSIYDRYLFAFLSINTAFRPNCEAFGRMRGRYWTDEQETLASIRLTPSIAFAPTKAKDIVAFGKRYLAHPETFRLRPGETPAEARDRLNIQGLGQAKLSFALALCSPVAANVACLDRHVQRWFTGKPVNTLSARQYRRMEIALSLIGRRYGVSTFVAQWAVWDWMRGYEETHGIIADEKGGVEIVQASRAIRATVVQ